LTYQPERVFHETAFRLGIASNNLRTTSTPPLPPRYRTQEA
jgi:hypothetical protein